MACFYDKCGAHWAAGAPNVLCHQVLPPTLSAGLGMLGLALAIDGRSQVTLLNPSRWCTLVARTPL